MVLPEEKDDNNDFCSSIFEATKKMLMLSNLTLFEKNHIFCEIYIFKVIETVSALDKYVLIEPIRVMYYYDQLSCHKNIEIRQRGEKIHLNHYFLASNYRCTRTA